MDELFNNKVESIKDRYLQSSFGLWNAVLTINGILLAAFSLVKSNTNLDNSLILIATILSVFSVACIVYNFIAAKSTYFRIGEVLNDPSDLTEEKRKKDIEKALSRYRIIILSEKACLFVLIVNSLIVLVLVGSRFYAENST